MNRGRRGLVVALVAGASLLAAGAAPAHAEGEDERPLLRPLICDSDGVCVAYLAALADSDGDGVPDIDEDAAGTKPDDPLSMPRVVELVGVLGKGVLPSFELGLSEVIVLPESYPDGTPLIADAVTAFEGRSSALERMGVAGDLLKAYGIDLRAGLVLDQAAGAIGMHLDKDGRPVRGEKEAPVQKRVGGVVLGWIGADADGGTGGEKGDGAPVDMSGSGAFGSDRNGGKDFWDRVKDGVKDMFSGDKKPDKPDGGTPNTLTTGDDGGAVMPLTPADMEKVIVKLGATTKPVADDPKIGTDVTGVDLNPRRTIILTDDPEQKKLPADILKIILVTPDPDDPTERNTNFGPNGGIVPGVQDGSGWPKP